jgi:hypothetical protein
MTNSTSINLMATATPAHMEQVDSARTSWWQQEIESASKRIESVSELSELKASDRVKHYCIVE